MNKKIIVFGILIILILSSYPVHILASSSWWNNNWNYKIKITIDQTKIDADLTDFPILIYLNSSRINWNHVQDDLDDLRFIDSTQTVILKAELEKYVVNDKAWIWVKILTIDDTVDTDFYIYYGNVGASSAWDAENVWESSAVMVQHMKDATTSTILDSTSYDNDGTKLAANEPLETASGKIDSAQSFDGINDYINCGHNEILNILDEITISVWVKFLAVPSGEQTIIAKNLYHRSYELTYHPGNDKFKFNCRNPDIQAFYSNLVGLVADKWYHVVATVKAGEGKIYVNLDAKTTAVDAMHRDSYPLLDLLIGQRVDETNKINAVVDEVRIYDTAKSAEWIKADYNSEANTLLIYGDELLLSFLLTVYYNMGISKVYINGTLITNGTVINTAFDVNLNATTITKRGYIFFKNQLNGFYPNFISPYIFNMTTDNILWIYSVSSIIGGGSEVITLYQNNLASIIAIFIFTMIIIIYWLSRKD